MTLTEFLKKNPNLGIKGGLMAKKQGFFNIFFTLSMKMYRYIVDDTPLVHHLRNLLNSIFEFSHLLIRELVEGLSPN